MVRHSYSCDGRIRLGEYECSCGTKRRHRLTYVLGRVSMKSRTKDQVTAAVTFALVILIIGLVAAPWVGVLLFFDAPGVALFWTAVAEACVLVLACAIALGNLTD